MKYPTTRMLGRDPAKHDPRTLRLRDFRRPTYQAPPASRLWHAGLTDFGIMGNNDYGNCVIVTPAHALLIWRANESHDTKRITDEAVIELSRTMDALHGYNILDRLKYWRSTGMWGNRLWCFAANDPANAPELRSVIDSFGIADIGLAMPRAWQSADVWDAGTGPAYRPNTWGGHSVPLCGYDEKYFYCITWGAIQKITPAAIAKYCDESYALIDEEWFAKDSVTPSNYDLPALFEQLKAVTA